MFKYLAITNILFLLTLGCETNEDDDEVQCGCDGEVVSSFESRTGYVEYIEPEDDIFFIVHTGNDPNDVNEYSRYLPCNLNSDDRRKLSVDSLPIRVSGAKLQICPWARIKAPNCNIYEYTILEDDSD